MHWNSKNIEKVACSVLIVKEVKDDSANQLQKQFLFRIEPLIDFTEDLEEIIQKANDSIEDQDKKNHNQAVGQLMSNQSCYKTS